jgi:hypothetical protein
MSWQVGFAAVSALLGEPGDEVVAAMGGAAAAGGAGRWVLALRDASRGPRARELARAVAPLVADLEKVRLV